MRRIRNKFRVHERHEPRVVFDQPLGLGPRYPARVKKEIRFHLVAHYLGENQFTDTRCAKGEDGLVQAPRGHNPASEDI